MTVYLAAIDMNPNSAKQNHIGKPWKTTEQLTPQSITAGVLSHEMASTELRPFGSLSGFPWLHLCVACFALSCLEAFELNEPSACFSNPRIFFHIYLIIFTSFATYSKRMDQRCQLQDAHLFDQLDRLILMTSYRFRSRSCEIEAWSLSGMVREVCWLCCTEWAST